MADIKGINTARIQKMQSAIEEWAKAVDNAKITVSSKNVAKAIKGNTQADQVKSLCQACDSYADSLTVKLRNYKERLETIKKAYVKNDADSTAISSVTSEIKNLKS